MPPALSTAALGVQQFLATHSCEYRLHHLLRPLIIWHRKNNPRPLASDWVFWAMFVVLLFHFRGLGFFLDHLPKKKHQIPKTQTWEQHSWQALPAQQLDLFNRKPGQCESYIGTIGIMAYLPTFYHKNWPKVGKIYPTLAFRIWMDLFKRVFWSSIPPTITMISEPPF